MKTIIMILFALAPFQVQAASFDDTVLGCGTIQAPTSQASISVNHRTTTKGEVSVTAALCYGRDRCEEVAKTGTQGRLNVAWSDGNAIIDTDGELLLTNDFADYLSDKGISIVDKKIERSDANSLHFNYSKCRPRSPILVR